MRDDCELGFLVRKALDKLSNPLNEVVAMSLTYEGSWLGELLLAIAAELSWEDSALNGTGSGQF